MVKKRNNLFREWKNDITHHKKQIALSIFFLITALVLNYLAGNYTTLKAEVKEVPDLILDHIPTINLNFIFVWLFIIVISVIILYPLVYWPKKLHYFLSVFSLFIVIRSFFIILTHLKTPAESVVAKFPFFINEFLFLNDLFFSGHVGVPFLGFLIFRHYNSKISYFMLASSIVLALTVLLMHAHYSIDVFAAFFITYGIFKVGNWLSKIIHDD